MHEIPYPTSHIHMSEFLQVRHSEPCPSYGRTAGVSEKFSSNPPYVSIKKELMATSLGSRGSKQAPRFPVVILAALEELLTDLSQPAFFRIMAWWLLLQSRFADHRGLVPRNIHVEGGSLFAKLTRSKTLGTDKPVSSRLVIVDSEAYVRTRSWAETTTRDSPIPTRLPAPGSKRELQRCPVQ